ncbi:MAG: hypothetical protein ACE5IP_03990 [Terriglobia bacterium]
MVATLVSLALATLVYIPYHLSAPHGPSGGSFLGLTYGIVGSVLMLFAGLLAARKKVPVWRLGRAQSWMRGHLWLGLLSFPLILFHGGFAFGGPLTTTLMILFIIVIVSGVLGAAFQHYIPHIMTIQAPMETIYEEIGNVRRQLCEEADQLVAAVCGPLGLGGESAAANGGAEGTAVATLIEVEKDESIRLREFYAREMRPFLEKPDRRHQSLGIPSRARGMFEQLRTLLPVALHETVEDLENICEEERQMNRQVRLHRWLHGWLLVHIPLSLVLLVLGAVHAVMALRY